MITIEDLEQFNGSISPAEALLLSSFAAKTDGLAIVEIGSWQGKSSIALAIGASEQAVETRPLIHCIDPHATFKGVYGGRFNPDDREAFYKNMLRSGCSKDIALINLPSTQAALAWSDPIGLLFIDGDHTPDGVQADADAWIPFISKNGVVLFDDATDKNIGPILTVEKLLKQGTFEKIAETGKIVALKKL